MFKFIGFDLHMRVTLDQWPFVKIWFGKVWRVKTAHGDGTQHEIFNG